MTDVQAIYDELFFDVFQRSPNDSKPLEEYSDDERTQFIDRLKQTLHAQGPKRYDERLEQNEDFGLSIVAGTRDALNAFEEFCTSNSLPVSKKNCFVTTTCDSSLIEHYLLTGLNHRHIEYAMIVLLPNVQYTPCSYGGEFTLNQKRYEYTLQMIPHSDNESQDELLRRIRCSLIGDMYFLHHDDHASVPSLPGAKQPYFVAMSPSSQIACWPLPRRRDLKRFRQELGVTHVLTLLNSRELIQTQIVHGIESAGLISLHVPIEGADLSVYTSSQATVDVLVERLPAICDLLLTSSSAAPVKMLIHCAAGLHRTGTITYLILRLCQLTMDQALLIIHRTRPVTARQVGQRRIDAVESHLLRRMSSIRSVVV